MFLPINDNNRRIWIRYHYVTLALIAAAVAMFGIEIAAGEDGYTRLVYGLGVIPSVLLGERTLAPDLALVPPVLTLITSLFVHGGVMHLLGNMLFLWVFGDNIEDSMGHRRFLAFFLLIGAVAGLAQTVADPASTMPTIGASGAISGVLGAYFVLHPRVRVWILLFAWIPVRLPSFVVLGLWAALQLLNSMAGDAAASNVAWWAHLAGFVAGAVLIRWFKYPHVALFDTSEDGAPGLAGVRLRGSGAGKRDE